jgi:hypothetical protein
VKKVLSILSIFPFLGLIAFPLAGCGQTPISGESEQPIIMITNPALPLLDKQTHGPVDTAYFALG